MIEKIARRAGGFASTTALRWMGAGAEKVADVSPIGDSGHDKHSGSGKLVAGAAAGAVALIAQSKFVRSGLERGLRAAADAVRATPPASNGKASSNGSASRNGNGSRNGKAIGDLAAATRTELYELAKKMDLPGRSGMSKEELKKALSG